MINNLLIFIVCASLIIFSNIITIIIQKKLRRYDGIFHVDLLNPEKDVFTLEMITSFDEVPSKKELYLKVHNIDK